MANKKDFYKPKIPRNVMVETDTGSISVSLVDILSVEITGKTVLVKYFSGQRTEIGYNRVSSAQTAFDVINRANNKA